MKHLPYLILVLVLFLSFQYTNAQTTPPPPPNGGGGAGTVNDTPINFLIYPLMLLGTYIGLLWIKKPSN